MLSYSNSSANLACPGRLERTMSHVCASAAGMSRSFSTADQNFWRHSSVSGGSWSSGGNPFQTQIRWRRLVSAFSAAFSEVKVKFIRCRYRIVRQR